MNGLDLTGVTVLPAFNGDPSLTVLLILFLATGVGCLIGTFRAPSNDEVESHSQIGMVIGFIFGLLLVALIVTGIQSDSVKVTETIAQGYGVSDLACEWDKDFIPDDGTYSCTIPNRDVDMTRYTDTDTTVTLDCIIRDKHAYLYDEDGNLMETKH